MKNHLFNGLFIFIILLISSNLLMQTFNTQFGVVDFFENHGLFFLFFIAIFPRLTLLFSNIISGGFLWWLSFIFCPRILVATMATMAYFKTNPMLVVISWLIAIPAEAAEKYSFSRPRFQFKIFRSGISSDFFRPNKKSNQHPKNSEVEKGDIVDAEYRVIDDEKRP